MDMSDDQLVDSRVEDVGQAEGNKQLLCSLTKAQDARRLMLTIVLSFFLYALVDVDKGEASWLSFFEKARELLSLFSHSVLCRLALRLILFAQWDARILSAVVAPTNKKCTSHLLPPSPFLSSTIFGASQNKRP
jgi:hypothetical protein